MIDLIYKEESYAIVGACFEVYNDKGFGFLEAVYQECLEIELASRGVPFVPQAELSLSYKGIMLRRTYQSDLICFGKIILELKAVAELNNEHRAQLHNYLKATRLRLGLLVNSGHKAHLEYERVVY